MAVAAAARKGRAVTYAVEKQLKVYMRTRQNVLIEFHESVRIPRTYKRFAGLMVQLLHKLKVRAADGRETLLKVIKNPIQRHLPPDCVCYGFSVQGDRYTPGAFAATLPDKPVCFVIGAMAAGHVDRDDFEAMVDYVSLSEYPLSGATAINRLLGAIEAHRGIS